MIDRVAKFGRFLVRQSLQPTETVTIGGGLGLYSSGWEPRALEFTRCKHFEPSQALAFRFSEPADTTAEELQHEQIAQFLTGKGIRFDDVALSPVAAVEGNSERLARLIQALPTPNSPTVFIEASIIPRIYLQKIVYRLLGQNTVPRVVIGYAIGAYQDAVSPAPAPLTEGQWLLDSVVTGRGATMAESRRRLIAVLGVETEKTIAMVRDVEPYGVDVICPTREGVPALDKTAADCAETLRNDPSLRHFQMRSIPHWDMIGCTKAVIDVARAIPEGDTLTFSGLGPKPLALSGLIAYLAGHQVEVVGRVAKRYLPVQIHATGDYALYDIVNLCHPACTKLPPEVFKS